MSLTDYLNKHLDEARQDGIRTATRTAGAEALSKTVLRWVVDQRAEPIWSQDWDICLVLDGCRWDTWQEVDGRGRPSYSVGATSLEWISQTFAEEYEDELARTGYVTANPNTDRTEIVEDKFKYIDELWRDQWDTGAEKTVSPTDVTDRAMWAWHHRDELGCDQLLVHYMQPHAPFRSLGEKGGWDPYSSGYESIWNLLRDGEISREEFLAAYADNLTWVLEEVDRWEDQTGADILITSDHGNAMGELGDWGHKHKQTGNPAVRRVPLVTVEGTGDDSGLETVDPPGDPPATDQNMAVSVEERLRGFGYL